MPDFLPDFLMGLFIPRPPIEYKPPPDKLLVDKVREPITGVAQYIHLFEDPADTPPKPIIETKADKRSKRHLEKAEVQAYKLEYSIACWNPVENKKATQDPYKTLFVSRINYETSASKLRREFEKFGDIRKVVMVNDRSGKPRGYAFIEYAHKSDMSNAYKKADGIKIDGRRVLVDYERGRTQKSWLPRRLGGGKGDTRKTRKKIREESPSKY